MGGKIDIMSVSSAILIELTCVQNEKRKKKKHVNPIHKTNIVLQKNILFVGSSFEFHISIKH